MIATLRAYGGRTCEGRPDDQPDPAPDWRALPFEQHT